MEEAVHALLAEVAAPPILVFPDWDALIDKSRPFHLHCDVSTDGLGAELEEEQPDGSIHPIVYSSRPTFPNERNWTPLELEAGCVVWSMRHLCRYLFNPDFHRYECIQQISKIGESKPRIQRWMGFLSAYNCRHSYRRGRDNANADFLSRLPILPIVDDISGSSTLTDPDDLAVYFICAYGYITSSCPIPGVGLGGLTPSYYNNLGTGPNPFPTPVLSGLPPTKDDFRTHLARMPLRRMTGPTTSPFATPTDEPCSSYAIDDHHEASRSNCARRTRSGTGTLAGNIPLRPDYRMAARSVFAASAAPAPAPKSPRRLSSPPRSARLGSTIPVARPTSPRLATVPNPLIDHSPPAAFLAL